MAAPKSRSVEAKIRKLTRELDDIDRYFYRSEEAEDRFLYAGMLERKRDDIVRSTVLQLHTSIEDLLDKQITHALLGEKKRGKNAQALRRILHGAGSIGFDMKLNLAQSLGIMNSKRREALMELNTLRNKCSHNWLLKMPVRRGRRPGQKKPPLLHFRGQDLHNTTVLKEFYAIYGTIYALMFAEAL